VTALPVDGDAVGGDAVDGAANAPIPGMTVGGGPTQAEGQSFFEAVGGHQTFSRIVRSFYDGVAGDPVLGPMYPAHDMDGAVERLTLFLEQYWGGPPTYSDRRGHPRLRMRHAGFLVNPDARDHWVSLMRAAVEGAGLSPLHQATLLDYLERAAHSMINTFEPTPKR
jgi:hemoglobin